MSSDTKASSVPEEPWLEKSWSVSSPAYKQLRELYSGYFEHIHWTDSKDRALIDVVMCQLGSFVDIDALLDRRLLLLLVNSFAESTERYLHRHEFISLMFFLSYTSREQQEEAIFHIVSAGASRVTVGQLVQLHVHHMQRRVSISFINLVSECDSSGCGQLDVYDFRLLIGKLQETELHECGQQQPPLELERAKLEEALLEAHELQSWSWCLDKPDERCSLQLRNLGECRALLAANPQVAGAVSKLAWDYPEILSTKFVEMAIKHCSAKIKESSLSKIEFASVLSSSSEDASGLETSLTNDS